MVQPLVSVAPSGPSHLTDALWLWEELVAAEDQQREAARQELLQKVLILLPPFFLGKRVVAVYLCGSLLRPGRFYPFSDIDLAVAGLQEDYFALLAALEELLAWPVDLIEWERCRWREQIAAAGLRLV